MDRDRQFRGIAKGMLAAALAEGNEKAVRGYMAALRESGIDADQILNELLEHDGPAARGAARMAELSAHRIDRPGSGDAAVEWETAKRNAAARAFAEEREATKVAGRVAFMVTAVVGLALLALVFWLDQAMSGPFAAILGSATVTVGITWLAMPLTILSGASAGTPSRWTFFLSLMGAVFVGLRLSSSGLFGAALGIIGWIAGVAVAVILVMPIGVGIQGLAYRIKR
ncbi:MAG: hypothetical protein ACYC5J_06995 [Chloroflexota bacterium]